MYKLKHVMYSMLNPFFYFILEILQEKNINVYRGHNSTRKVGSVLRRMDLKKPLIVTDKVIVNLGLMNNMLDSIKEEELDYVIYDGIKSDPTTSIINYAVDTFIENKCDSIIAFGGGSSLDAAKVISGVAKNPGIKNFFGLIKMLSFSLRRGTYPLLAVPTTAGTGAEVTMGAVISNDETFKKDIVIDQKFISREVFLDPNLTIGLPSHITAQTGFDALAHAIEAYLSRVASKQSKKHSIIAIKDIFTYLPVAYNEPGNLEAREKVLNASLLAGHAINRAYIGNIHSIAHNAGAEFSIPHGLIVGVVLPHVLELYLDKCKIKFAEISRKVGISNSNEDEVAAKALLDTVSDLYDKVELPKTLDNLESDKFEDIAIRAIEESYLYPIPKFVSKEEIVSILNKIKR